MNYYNEIKKELVDNEVYKKIKDYSKNKYELERYYNVGKLLIEAQGGEARAKYGNSLIKQYSKRLIDEVGKKYSERNLRNMRKFYILFKDEIWNAMRSKLTWTHYRELLIFEDKNIISYYINISINQNLTYRQLHQKIKSNEYERIDNMTKIKLANHKEINIIDNIKHPIIIKNKYNVAEINEKILKSLILEDISGFMKELGDGFSFIDSEFKIKFNDRYNYIDILLFNYIYNCFVVIEFKVTELKKEHIGQIQVYMNYIDKHIKHINHNRTIGIIIAKKDNKFVMEYCSDSRIYQTTYELI